MSQLGQAINSHEEATQRLEEGRQAFLQLKAKRERGEISEEAFSAEVKPIRQALEDCQQFNQRARQQDPRSQASQAEELSELEAGFTSTGEDLRALDEEPVYLRPMGAGDAEPESISPGGGRSSRARLLTGARRNAVNQWLCAPESVNPRVMRQFVSPLIQGKGVGGTEIYNEIQAHRLRFASGMHNFVSPYVDSEGGGFGGIEIDTEMLREIREMRVLRERVRIKPTNEATFAVPAFKTKAHIRRTRAGLGPIGEDQSTDTRDVLGFKFFQPAGQMAFIDLPEEVIEDGQDVLAMFTEEVAETAFDQDEELMLTSKKQPVGILEAPIPGGPHSGVGGGDFGAVDMRIVPRRLKQRISPECIWVSGPEFFVSVLSLRDGSGGSADSGQFMFQNSPDIGGGFRIDHHPAYQSTAYPDYVTQGNAGDPIAVFFRPSDYWLIERVAWEIRRIEDTDTGEKGVVRIRFRRRWDAAPVRMESFYRLERK